MWFNHFKTALRAIRRQKAYAAINILGLSVGLACSFFILLWMQDELRYDRYFEDGDQLYRVMRHAHFSDGQIFTWAAIPMPLAQVLKDDFPEVTHYSFMTWSHEEILATGTLAFREDGRYVSPDFFQMFDYVFLAGDPETALQEPTGLVLTESLARKYFGDRPPTEILGEAMDVSQRKTFFVTGVIQDVPRYSTYGFDYLLPAADFLEQRPWLEHWGNNSLRLLVKLQSGTDGEAFSEKIAGVINANHEGANAEIFLQPYENMHLYGDYRDGRLVGGRIEYVRLFGIVAALILLIACINFMNLATARSSLRSREIGVRKAIGATQGSLIRQFLGESMFMALAAMLVAMGLVALALPAFSDLTGKAVGWSDLVGPVAWAFVGLTLLTGVLAGSYPALFLSSFGIVEVLRAGRKPRTGSVGLRKGLVVFQFAMSILLIIGTLGVYRQLDFIMNKQLGLDREHLIHLRLEGGIEAQYGAFKEQLMAEPGVVSMTRSSQNPLSIGSSTSDPSWDGKDPEREVLFHIIDADHDFIETMRMNIVAGRDFSRAFAADSVNYIINQRAAVAMDMAVPVGEALSFWEQEGTIVGVVQDFHMSSLYNEIEPTIIRIAPDNAWRVFIRVAAGSSEAVLSRLEALYTQFNPAYPFEYTFLDDVFERTYRNERVIGRLANFFAGLAIFIACLGLVGLASFTAEQRTKEIGIRKVLGASLASLVLMLSRDFILLVVVAFVLATPLAWYALNAWLTGFAFHAALGWGIFAGAGLAAVAIAWLAVGYQYYRAAAANPVDSLRAE